MAGNTARDGTAELGELELTILLFVWRSGAITAQQVREELGPPFDGSTVRTALRRLEDAGCVVHSVEGHTILYRPAEPHEQSPGERVAGRIVKPLQIHL
jgi:predicted transcriptional regulator